MHRKKHNNDAGTGKQFGASEEQTGGTSTLTQPLQLPLFARHKIAEKLDKRRLHVLIVSVRIWHC